MFHFLEKKNLSLQRVPSCQFNNVPQENIVYLFLSSWVPLVFFPTKITLPCSTVLHSKNGCLLRGYNAPGIADKDEEDSSCFTEIHQFALTDFRPSKWKQFKY